METDHRSSDEPEPEPVASDDRGGSRHVRSYECTFCKRGFSNAQALGGHMNIHRKDRAKLKQPTNHHQSPFNFPDKFVPSNSPVMNSSNTSRSVLGGYYDPSCMFKCPWAVGGEHGMPSERTYSTGPRQLPLFVETPSPHGDDRLYKRQEEEWSGHGPVAELDLELRLGLKPPDLSMGL